MNLHEMLKGGIPKGQIVNICAINSTKDFLDIVKRTSQTTRRESIAWFCLEQPELPKDFVEALKNG